MYVFSPKELYHSCHCFCLYCTRLVSIICLKIFLPDLSSFSAWIPMSSSSGIFFWSCTPLTGKSNEIKYYIKNSISLWNRKYHYSMKLILILVTGHFCNNRNPTENFIFYWFNVDHWSNMQIFTWFQFAFMSLHFVWISNTRRFFEK